MAGPPPPLLAGPRCDADSRPEWRNGQVSNPATLNLPSQKFHVTRGRRVKLWGAGGWGGRSDHLGGGKHNFAFTFQPTLRFRVAAEVASLAYVAADLRASPGELCVCIEYSGVRAKLLRRFNLSYLCYLHGGYIHKP